MGGAERVHGAYRLDGALLSRPAGVRVKQLANAALCTTRVGDSLSCQAIA